jgi:hypothetical protein
MYLFMAVGLALTIWPGLVSPPAGLAHARGVVRFMLGAVSLLALLGLRFTLQMLPVMFFELVWKMLWVVIFGLPLWLGHRADAETKEALFACLLGVVLFPLVIPWGYVLRRYVKAPADRWRSARAEP